MSQHYAPVGPFDSAVVSAVQSALVDEADGFARLGRPVHAPKVLRALLAAKAAPDEPSSGVDEVYISSDPTYGLRVFGHRDDAEAYAVVRYGHTAGVRSARVLDHAEARRLIEQEG